MLHAGIGPNHVNALLTSMNVPAVSENTLKAREREIGPVIESIAKSSCLKALETEKNYWVPENTSQEPSRNIINVAIGASYDMGWQKRGKGHNSLTGKYWMGYKYAGNENVNEHLYTLRNRYICNHSLLHKPIPRRHDLYLSPSENIEIPAICNN